MKTCSLYIFIIKSANELLNFLCITDAVLLNCYYYLKDSKKYSFIDHLPDIGKVQMGEQSCFVVKTFLLYKC